MVYKIFAINSSTPKQNGEGQQYPQTPAVVANQAFDQETAVRPPAATLTFSAQAAAASSGRSGLRGQSRAAAAPAAPAAAAAAHGVPAETTNHYDLGIPPKRNRKQQAHGAAYASTADADGYEQVDVRVLQSTVYAIPAEASVAASSTYNVFGGGTVSVGGTFEQAPQSVYNTLEVTRSRGLSAGRRAPKPAVQPVEQRYNVLDRSHTAGGSGGRGSASPHAVGAAPDYNGSRRASRGGAGGAVPRQRARAAAPAIGLDGYEIAAAGSTLSSADGYEIAQLPPRQQGTVARGGKHKASGAYGFASEEEV